MLNYCEVCGGVGCHRTGCPEGPQDKPLHVCDECGNEIFVGDTAFKVTGFCNDKWYCCECCSLIEVEAPDEYEPDWDDIRKDRLEREI